MTKTNAHCQNCGTKCEQILNLGEQIICNRFFKSKEQLGKEKKYPLVIVFCPKCSLVQQSIVIPTNKIFDINFNYLSSASRDAVMHFTKLAKTLIKEYNLKKGDYVVAIGSNDGTELKPFKEKGIGVIGVEPAPKPAKMANDMGIYTIVDQFEKANKKIMEESKGKVRILSAFNVMAHTGSIHKFLENVKKILVANPNAVFINQGQYLPDIIEKVSYDTLYHEHSRFYTVTSMQNLFEGHGLHIYDCERISYYGGSIIVYASSDLRQRTKRLEKLLETEKEYTKLKKYKQFSNKVVQRRDELLKLLNKLKGKGKSIVGGGAPMKSSVLLNYCKIDSNTLDILTESNSLKIGTYSPSGIKVADEHTYFKNHNPDYVLILSWNMAENMMKDLRGCGFKGKFIIPLPELRVVD
ncbi:MAG: methyltransferase domain-containing protein [Candidatus Micrarchaeota archaeon]|nr:methyltransferase domain-containing protein [Candidatus Micrarchaeota archaeon]